MKVLQMLTIGLLGLSLSALAEVKNLTFEQAYVRAPIPGTKNTAGYMKLINHSDTEITLVKAESHFSDRVEFHDHIMENGVMRMTQVPVVKIEAKSSLEFSSGGLHLMLLDLAKNNKSDGPIAISFTTSKGQILTAHFEIQSIHHEHHHH